MSFDPARESNEHWKIRLVDFSSHRHEFKLRTPEPDLPEFTIWLPCGNRAGQPDEIIAKGRVMVDQDLENGTKNITTVINLADQLVNGDFDRIFRSCPAGSFGVLETDLPYRVAGAFWYAYFTKIENKSCLLLISEHQDRVEVERRARRWVRYCPKREDHGEPVLMDLAGNILK